MNTGLKQEILTQEEKLTQATRQLDIEALGRIYADDIMFTGVTGVVCSKTALMDEAGRGLKERQAAGEGKAAVVAYDKEDIRIVAETGVGVASYRFVVGVQMDGKQIQHRYRTTNVWIQREGQWQVIAAHTASLKEV